MATKKRGQNEGGLYQRESDGRWVGAIDLGYVNGKRKRKTVYGKTQVGVSSSGATFIRNRSALVVGASSVPSDRKT